MRFAPAVMAIAVIASASAVVAQAPPTAGAPAQASAPAGASGTQAPAATTGAETQAPASDAAAPADEATYQRTVAAAVAEYDRGNWAEARALFLEAHALSPSARTWRTLGMTAFEQRDYVSALRELGNALSDERRPLDDALRAEVQSLLERTRAFVGRYRVTLEPSDATLLVDDRPARLEEDGTLLLGLGEHRLRAQADGHTPVTRALRVQGHEDAAIALRLEAERAEPIAEAAPVVAAPTPTAAEPADEPTGLLWTWGAGAAAIVLGGTALGLWIAAGSEYDTLKNECKNMPDGMCVEGDKMNDVDDSKLSRLETLTTVALIGAGVAAAATVALIVIESDDDSDTRVEVGAGHVRFATHF